MSLFPPALSPSSSGPGDGPVSHRPPGVRPQAPSAPGSTACSPGSPSLSSSITVPRSVFVTTARERPDAHQPRLQLPACSREADHGAVEGGRSRGFGIGAPGGDDVGVGQLQDDELPPRAAKRRLSVALPTPGSPAAEAMAPLMLAISN
ncbi:hypothetical protein GCM10010276_37670 [Streptomyces longisporus]|uniref:Uncharacterized protein n=1 Tax=Streptomyces longisporus TaxID=1948 RepID=A0ABN3M105_STRLO